MMTGRLISIVAVVAQCSALLSSPPRFVKQPSQEEIIFQTKNPFVLECEAEGQPPPTYRWLKDGKPFNYTGYGTRIIYQPGQGTFTVSKPREEDAGQYQCFADNELGTASSNSVFVRKAELNSFKETKGEQVITVNEGAPLKLTCEPPDGHPKPRVYWMLQGDQGQLKAIANPRITWDPTGNLWLSNVTLDDSYAYVCVVNSVVRNEYKLGNRINLVVTKTGNSTRMVNQHGPILQYTTSKLEKALHGKEARLYCIYGGTPLPRVVWNQNGRRLRSTSNIILDNYGKTLVIKHPTTKDKGIYTCEVSNGVGAAQSYSITLNIEVPPFFTVEPEIQSNAEGESVQIHCKASGNPVPNITWIHNGKPIEQAELNPRRQVTANKIIITNLLRNDTGNYGCNATNSVGYIYKDIFILVHQIPNPPQMEGIECLNRTAKLRWSMGDNRAPILRFSIQYNTTFTPDTWDLASDTVPAIDNSWTVNLTPWANSTYRVIAWNGKVKSAPSAHSGVCSAPPDVPYRNPSNVKGVGTAPNNMIISWSKMPQLEHHGPGFHYRVAWRRDHLPEQWNEHQISDWQNAQFLVGNTPTFQPYKITVTAANMKGKCSMTPIVVTGWSGEGEPKLAPANFSLQQVTSSKVSFFWSPVPPDSVQGYMKGYKIHTWINESRYHEFLVSPTATSTNVSFYDPFVKINARIFVYNGRFNGPPSEVISFVTPEGKPGPVKSFKVYSIGSTALLLWWDKPVEENGILTGYKVYYRTVIDDGDSLGPLQERKKVIDPKFDRAKLAGLEPNTKYRIEIRAMTKAGEGDRYYVEQRTRKFATTVPDVPMFETHILPALNKEDTINVLVRWLPSFGHAGTHFVVCHRPRSLGSIWNCTQNVTEDNYVLLHGLESSIVYEVQLTAHDGEFSRSSAVQYINIDKLSIKLKVESTGWLTGAVLALACLLLTFVLVCVLRHRRGGKLAAMTTSSARPASEYTPYLCD